MKSTMLEWSSPLEFLPETSGDTGIGVLAYVHNAIYPILYHPDRGWYCYDIHTDDIMQYTWEPDYWAYIPNLSDIPHSKDA